MSLNLYYSFREGIEGLRRARTATFITVSTLAVTLTLLGIFLTLTFNIRRIVELFRERMAFEVFVDNSLDMEEIRKLEREIVRKQGVEQTVFISREEALERFREELGEDPLALLGENPLPPSFQVTLRPEMRYPEGMESMVKELESLNGVDEVVYQGQLFQIVNRYSRIVLIVDGIFFLIVFVSTIFLVANTLRLTILAQKNLIQIMELVGATKGFIRRPYLIQGILQGGIGGIIGSLVVWGVGVLAAIRFSHLLEIPWYLILSPFFLGLLFGFFGSCVGLKHFTGVAGRAFLP